MQKLKRGAIQPLVRPLYTDLHPDCRRSNDLAGTEKSGTTRVSDIINGRRDCRHVFEPFLPAKGPVCKVSGSQQYLRPDHHGRCHLQAAETMLSGRVRDRWSDKDHRRFVAKQRLVRAMRWLFFFPDKTYERAVLERLRRPPAGAYELMGKASAC